MKKITITLAIVLLVCVASVFAFSACNFNKIIENLENADYTENYDADNKEGSIGLVNSFFEETLKDPDFVVTAKNKDGEVQFTENVKGTSSYTLGKDGSKEYAWKVGDYYYTAIIYQQEIDGETVERHDYFCSDSTKRGYFHEYEGTLFGEEKTITMEDTYNGTYCQFKGVLNGGINILKYFDEEKGTFTCQSHEERKDGVTTASLDFTYTMTDYTCRITITSEENLVKTYHVVISGSNPSESSEQTMTFVYGNASVTIPDIDAWDKAEEAEEARIAANEKALEAKTDFFADTTAVENVVVTVKINDKISYVQTIANEMECIDFGDYQIYTYLKQVDETTNSYYVFDGETKYYLINDDAYDSVVMYYYWMGICLYDSASEQGATLACNVVADTLTFTVSLDGETLATLVATKDGDTVSTATYTTKGDNGDVVTTYTFAYGNGSVTEPDLTDFVNSSAEGNDEVVDE